LPPALEAVSPLGASALRGDARLRREWQRLQALQQAGERPDPRDAQIARLKDEITALKQRLAQSAGTISDLAGFRTQALARLAAQHDEITQLRRQAQQAANVRRLPTATP
jgi:capsule polysaccharide export protein KpsE/RkpR